MITQDESIIETSKTSSYYFFREAYKGNKWYNSYFDISS